MVFLAVPDEEGPLPVDGGPTASQQGSCGSRAKHGRAPAPCLVQGAPEGRAFFPGKKSAPPAAHVTPMKFEAAGLVHTLGQVTIRARPLAFEVKELRVRGRRGIAFQGQKQMLRTLAIAQLHGTRPPLGAGEKDLARLALV